MKRFQEKIDKQIESNEGANLFNNEITNSLRFSPETLSAIGRIGEIDKDSENVLIDYVTNKVMQEFCMMNQYYTFNQQAQAELRDVYIELFSNIRNTETSIDSISGKHYENLTKWLQKTNPFAEKVYTSQDKIIEPVACSEYSPDLQIDVLQIDISQITEPVLDIGCGKHGDLVTHLRNNGIEAYGFDRFAYDNPALSNADWLKYEYGAEKWGTIISNLGFSNHFKHHHLREDGNFIGYAKKYMTILNSLKIGGSFHYAPDLPFIEHYLDKNKYQLSARNIGGYDFKATVIKRLK